MDKITKHRISVYGINGCHDAMESNLVEVTQVYVEKDSPAYNHNNVKKLCEKMPQDRVNILDGNRFRDKIDTNRSQGILIKAQASTFSSLPKTEKKNSCYVILDQVQDPHNLGQILRICAGASIDGVIITERNSVSMTSAVAQVSQGGFAKIPLYSVTNINQAITHFKKDDFWITSFENNIDAKDWYKIDLKGRSILIFGGEGNGVSKQVLKNSDFTATIPMSNQMNSLNVSSAVSAIVFERLRQVST
ncbi:MAG: TrmH family RNA methyltransferase [Candidatus Neomarinimicrobiota bacterium]